MTDFISLTAAEAETFAPLAFPAYRAWLAHVKPAGPVRAVGAVLDSQPIGLILGRDAAPSESPQSALPAQIVSLFVTPEQRGHGLGTALVAALEAALTAAGQLAVHLEYTHGQPTTPALEKILARQQWSTPACWARLYQIAGPQIAAARWLYYPLPQGFTTFPWQDLPATERAALQAVPRTAWWWPVELSPFSDEALIDPITSLGLRLGPELVGWLITHRVGPQTVRYTSLFVRETVRARLPGMALLAAGIRAQVAQSTPEQPGEALFMVKTSNVMMTRIAEKRLRPYCRAVHEIWGAHKPLQVIPPTA